MNNMQHIMVWDIRTIIGLGTIGILVLLYLIVVGGIWIENKWRKIFPPKK